MNTVKLALRKINGQNSCKSITICFLFLQKNDTLKRDELELKLKISITSLLLGTSPEEPYADLIASGQLTYDTSLCLPCDDFNEVRII